MARAEPDFAAWVDARRSALWRSAWLPTGDHHHAEDLLQTALLKVWPRWQRITASGDPEPYVRRVMIGDDRGLLTVSQIDPDDRVRGREQSPKPDQTLVAVAVTAR